MTTVLIVLIYGVVALTCLGAAALAAVQHMPKPDRVLWAVIAIAFALLIVIRLEGVEESLRQWLRGLSRTEGWYANRRQFQMPLALVTVLLAAAAGWLAWHRLRITNSRSRRAVWVAAMATLGYLPLYALRIVSLHLTDVLLYYGPVKVNWVVDGGLALVVAASAFYYGRRVMRRGRQPS
ncbi:hypothetical protein [Alteraurantiacibacter aquimixticola]|uniref:Uncharacterized protein n=1 Tax=Alteraurantiacibacter aquimixticola TaxID=2489173 RepID=A0A4T3EZJ7_9SPHN|nr:hypothetical protein [Alteraurantiacibacter aquimixticola]TIX48984.1 hypothetical protein E5222_14725 [Alteraurantiacibacter aquimixticola]